MSEEGKSTISVSPVAGAGDTLCRPGCVVAHKGGGFVSRLIDPAICLVRPSWRRREWKPWHLSVISRYDENLGWMIFEATAGGCIESPLSGSPDVRVFDWFGRDLSPARIKAWIGRRAGDRYDYLAYFRTAAYYLLDKAGIRPGRVVDRRYTCWELAGSFCAAMGKPLFPEDRYPFLPDIIDRLERCDERQRPGVQ